MKKSAFVDAVGWSFFLLSGFALILLGLNVLAHYTVLIHIESDEKFIAALTEKATESIGHKILIWHLKNSVLMIWFCLFLTVWSCLSSWFLLKRKKWARKSLMVFLLISNVSILLAGVLDVWMTVSGAEKAFLAASMQVDEAFFANEMFQQMQVLLVVVSMMGSAFMVSLLSWIFWKLCRPHIKAEFR